MPKEVIRATEEEKEAQIKGLEFLHGAQKEKTSEVLRRLQNWLWKMEICLMS
ncbi:MAG: hypothetical protein R2784_13085 [Saprospiraceae bacterium]